MAQINFTKNSNGSYFSIGSSCQPCLVQADFSWLHETTACCYFGVDMGKRLDHYSLSRLTDGTHHSSSDLLYFTLLLPFTWTNCSKSNCLSHFCLFEQKFSKSNSSSLFSSDKNIPSPTSSLQIFSFYDNSKFCLSRKIIPTSQKHFKSHFLLDLEKFPFLLTSFVLWPPESKQCPLTLAPVLACADSADEFRF